MTEQRRLVQYIQEQRVVFRGRRRHRGVPVRGHPRRLDPRHPRSQRGRVDNFQNKKEKESAGAVQFIRAGCESASFELARSFTRWDCESEKPLRPLSSSLRDTQQRERERREKEYFLFLALFFFFFLNSENRRTIGST